MARIAPTENTRQGKVRSGQADKKKMERISTLATSLEILQVKSSVLVDVDVDGVGRDVVLMIRCR